MASGKKSREARRQAATKPPPVQSKGGARARTASPKVLGIGAGVVLVIVAVVVGVIVLTNNKKSSSAASTLPAVGSVAAGLPGAADVQALLKGIPQKGLVLGSAFAPVKMVEYIDLQCPICQEFETTVMPDIIPRYVRTGKVQVEVRPWAFIGPDSVRGQHAMLAAAKQNKAFNYAQVLYDNQGTENTGWLNEDMVGKAAASVPGLKVQQLLTDRNSSTVRKQAANVAAQAQADQVSGTPTVLVGKSGSRLVYVPLQNGGDEATLVKALNNALNQ
ncbi:MAG TPA: thioredoxin domain-containing protein [Gaiellaceae bacterium]|nr:thioredoxin domain-containing protein [Gaiellaceae bacterium]